MLTPEPLFENFGVTKLTEQWLFQSGVGENSCAQISFEKWQSDEPSKSPLKMAARMNSN